MCERTLPGWCARAGTLAVLLAVAAAPAADAPPGGDDWKYDVVHLRQGATLRGLVVEQGPGGIQIRCISRKPGSPTVVFLEKLRPEEIDRVELLAPAERDLLRQRLESLRQERQVLTDHLKALGPGGREAARSGEAVDLQPVTWVDGRGEALAYHSARFRLVSNARAPVVQLAAVHLEQVYAAYVRCLPPRASSSTPTTILLARSLADYQALVRGRGQNLFNPAFYDPARNQIVCGSDLERLGDELERSRKHHAQLAAEANERLAELRRVYGGQVPAVLRLSIEEARAKIRAAEERNEAGFARAQSRLFRRLYHEAFHAYLANDVYPARAEAVPRWLNEGLAQLFETAIVEVGELRVAHADPERLQAVRQALARNTLLPLTDLLRSGPGHFVVAHTGDQQASDRYYLAAWALAGYLTFERKLLGTKALDDYVRALDRGADPVDAFRDLVGEPLPRFEPVFQRYLTRLRPDGSVGGP